MFFIHFILFLYEKFVSVLEMSPFISTQTAMDLLFCLNIRPKPNIKVIYGLPRFLPSLLPLGSRLGGGGGLSSHLYAPVYGRGVDYGGNRG